VPDLNRLDLDEIATALANQTSYEHRWLINPQTGEIAFWTADTGIDGQTPVDLDDLDLVCIDPLPSQVWYQDMADFAERISDERAGRRLAPSGDTAPSTSPTVSLQERRAHLPRYGHRAVPRV